MEFFKDSNCGCLVVEMVFLRSYSFQPNEVLISHVDQLVISEWSHIAVFTYWICLGVYNHSSHT